MTYRELYEKLTEILPQARMEVDSEGQIVLYTNLKEGESDQLEDFVTHHEEACPGCGSLPGDGVLDGCDHPFGCAFER